MPKQQFTAQFSEVQPVNKEFSLAKVQVCYANENRNKSNIPKEVIEAAIPTLYSIPVVGEYIFSKDDFGSHGGKIVIQDNNIEFIQTTMPYGFVPSDATVGWETGEDGKDYLTVDGAILWTGRYPEALAAINEGRPQSMEVEFLKSSFNETTGFTDVEEMNFSALCILGEDVTPCFEDAKIEAFSYSREEIINQIKEMMFEFSKLQGGETVSKFDSGSQKHIDINNTKAAAVMNGSWGDVDKTSLRNELTSAENAGALVNEGYLIVDSDYEDAPSTSLHYPHHVVENGTLVVHKAGLEAAYARLMQNDPHNEKALKHVERHYKELGLDMSNFSNENFALTSEQLEGELRMIVTNEESYVDPFWGFSEPRFYYVDNDGENVIVQDLTLNDTNKAGGLVGVPFSQNGDLVEVDFDKSSRFKINYVPMELGVGETSEGVSNASEGFALYTPERMEFIRNKFSEMSKFQEESEDLKKQLEESNEKFEALSSEIGELKQFKEEKESNERQEKEDILFEKFANQLTEEELISFKENAKDISVEELETQLAAFVGKKVIDGKFSFDNKKTLRVPLFEEENIVRKTKSKKVYADLIEDYRSNKE